ncbi:flavodoxin [Clostridioides difficile]|nr:flavodoxin [Clostridioides difficile]MCP8398074.1 flavodoxin [Clostridioides difficile]MCP8413614.1 flavodoxin [Clostridioides difficile]MCP8415309.1 flavodoxin [Clostridioides difficile]MCP8657793.1 flavodoxin [Clostridioides difficile]
MPETTDSKNMTEEEDNSTVVIDGKVMGNTQYVAMEIQEKTSADIFRIEPETPYTTNHEELVDIASQEQEENTRPAIKDRIADFEQYDTVFVGYPIWWSDLPMIMYSFFDEYDFSDKTIIPFSTHGGSGLADTISTIKELEPNATVYEQGLSISRNDVEKSSEEISQWLEKVIRE